MNMNILRFALIFIIIISYTCNKNIGEPELSLKTETINLVKNGDFEDGDPMPAYWLWYHPGVASPVEGFSCTVDQDEFYSGSRSVKIVRENLNSDDNSMFYQVINEDLPLGEIVTFSAFIKTRDVNTSPRLILMMYSEGNNVVGKIGRSGEKMVLGTTDWKRYSIKARIAPSTHSIMLYLFFNDYNLIKGTGTVWFDNVTLTYEKMIDN